MATTMTVHPTPLKGVYRIDPAAFDDARGYFVSAVVLRDLQQYLHGLSIVGVNRSFSKPQGVIRGIHFQRPPMQQDKIMQCLRGRIFDVVVDLRPDSPTYLQWTSAELSEENRQQMLIPGSCGHAFQTLTPDCLVEYYISAPYSPEHEGGIRWDDPALGITWPIANPTVSERDAAWPILEEGKQR